MERLTMKQYQQKMEKEHKGLELINSKLLEVDSFSRGKMLYDILDKINNDLKYYIFCKWWDSIDSYHSYFDGFQIQEWLDDANVQLDLDKLPFNSDGSLKVYRGTHEVNQGWEGLSWTTDIEIAKKFANGCGVRFQTKHPKLLVGFVEKEILCSIVSEGQEIDL